MRRREFIAGLVSAAAWPMAALGQQPERLRRVGVLVGLAENDTNMIARLAGLREGLTKRGWVEGRNIRIDYRYGPAGANAQALAKGLVASKPDVILAHTITMAAALQKESSTIPIVFVSLADPIGAGFVASLPRPGGNMTGLTTFEASIAGKWCSMLKEVAPGIKRAAFVANPEIQTYDFYLRAAQPPAAALRIELVPVPVKDTAAITTAIEEFSRIPESALIVPPDVFTVVHSELIITLAARHRLPAVYAFGYLIEAGGLMSYGTDRVVEMRQAAAYIDRILRGDSPATFQCKLRPFSKQFSTSRQRKHLAFRSQPGSFSRPTKSSSSAKSAAVSWLGWLAHHPSSPASAGLFL